MAYKSNKDKQEEYQKLLRLVSNYENNSDKVKLYIKWLEMKTKEKSNCFNLWNKYYDDVRKTKGYRLYKAMSKSCKKNDLARIRELKEFSSKLRIRHEGGNFEIEKPKMVNPYDFLQSQDVYMYKQAKQRLDDLNKESQEIESVAKEIFF